MPEIAARRGPKSFENNPSVFSVYSVGSIFITGEERLKINVHLNFLEGYLKPRHLKPGDFLLFIP